MSNHNMIAARTHGRPSIPTTRTVYNYKKANWEKAKQQMSEVSNSLLSEDIKSSPVRENYTVFKISVF